MYTYYEKIRYSETDSKLKLKLAGLVNFFQDAAIFEAEEGKINMDYLGEHHLAWLMGSWQIVIERMPRLNEKVSISTMPYCFKGFMGYRNFLMQTEDGEVLAKAASIWTLVDIQKMRPFRPTEEILASYPLSEKLDMEYKPRKILLMEEPKKQEPFRVHKSQIDSNEHVNNAEYVNMALDYVENSSSIKELRVEYKNAAYLGDVVVPYICEEAGRTQVVLRGEDKIYAVVEVSYE